MDFDACVAVTLDQEGNGRISLDPRDPGNWTGGADGSGELRGTRWGISAARYPDLDPTRLDRTQATALLYRDFWQVAGCGEFVAPIALLLFDAAVQHGPRQAVEFLQAVVGARQDGDPGPETQHQVHEYVVQNQLDTVIVAYSAQRVRHMMAQHSWASYAKSFSERVCFVMLRATEMLLGEGLPPPAPAVPGAATGEGA